MKMFAMFQISYAVLYHHTQMTKGCTMSNKYDIKWMVCCVWLYEWLYGDNFDLLFSEW